MIHCPDRQGILATVTEFLNKKGGNGAFLHLNLPILTTDIPLSKYLIYGRKDQGFLVNLHQIVRIHADRSEYKMYFLITKVVKYSSITAALFD